MCLLRLCLCTRARLCVSVCWIDGCLKCSSNSGRLLPSFFTRSQPFAGKNMLDILVLISRQMFLSLYFINKHLSVVFFTTSGICYCSDVALLLHISGGLMQFSIISCAIFPSHFL